MIRVYGYCIVRLVLICRAASSAFWRQWHGGLRLLAFVGVLTPSSSFAFTDTNPVVFSNVPLGTCMVDVQYDPSFSLALVQVRNGLSVFTPEGSYFVFGSATPNGTTLTALGLSSCGVSDVVLSNVKGADAGLGYAGQTYMGFEATYTRDAAAYQFTATIREDTPGTVTATSSEVLIPSNPKVISIVRQTPTNQATNADTLTFRVSFDKNVQNVDTTDFAVTGSTASVTNVSLQSTSVYDVTVSGGDLANLNGSVSLGFAGGQNIVDFTSNAVVDTTPTGANESYALDNIAPSYTVSNFLQLTDGATPFTITFNFDEDVFGFSQSAVAALLLNATASDLSETVPNRQFSLKITPNGNGDVTLLNGATWIAGDLAGNQNSAGSQYISTLDSTAPSITSIVRHNPTSAVTDADTLTWRVTFNEIVQGVAGDLGLWEIVGTTGSVTAVSPVGNGFGYWQHFDVTVSGGDLAGLTGQQVALSLRPTVGASIRDVVGNTVANTTPTGAHETYTVTQDNVAPSVQILDVPANHDGETAFQITV